MCSEALESATSYLSLPYTSDLALIKVIPKSQVFSHWLSVESMGCRLFGNGSGFFWIPPFPCHMSKSSLYNTMLSTVV